MRNMTMRVVVTGASGFLGSHLCDYLVARGDQVIAVDNFLTGIRVNIAHLLGRGDFTFLEHDVTLPITVPGRVDAILHFASPASPADYLAMPIETLRVGALGTEHALDLARVKGARMILASTSEVYGDPLIHPQREDYWGNVNPVGPRSVYDEAKRYAEALVTAHRSSRGVDTGVVRIFNTYGPRMRPADGRAIPTFLRQAMAREALTVAGNGNQTRSICYVQDLVRGIIAMMDSGHQGPVNLGNPDERAVLQIARDVIDAVGSDSPVRFVERPADDPQVRRPDIGLARRLLGWEPRVTWRDGLAETVDWYRRTHVLSA